MIKTITITELDQNRSMIISNISRSVLLDYACWTDDVCFQRGKHNKHKGIYRLQKIAISSHPLCLFPTGIKDNSNSDELSVRWNHYYSLFQGLFDEILSLLMDIPNEFIKEFDLDIFEIKKHDRNLLMNISSIVFMTYILLLRIKHSY